MAEAEAAACDAARLQARTKQAADLASSAAVTFRRKCSCSCESQCSRQDLLHCQKDSCAYILHAGTYHAHVSQAGLKAVHISLDVFLSILS